MCGRWPGLSIVSDRLCENPSVCSSATHYRPLPANVATCDEYGVFSHGLRGFDRKFVRVPNELHPTHARSIDNTWCALGVFKLHRRRKVLNAASTSVALAIRSDQLRRSLQIPPGAISNDRPCRDDSETHQGLPAARPTVGFATLNPPYGNAALVRPARLLRPRMQ
jgi:hypothetical protein